MSFLEIMDIVLVLVCVVTYALQVYFRVKGDVLAAVSELIATVEKSGLTGRDKMAKVVAELHKLVPKPMKGILNEQRLETIAQRMFDWMRRYADAYVEVTAATNTPKEREEKMKEAIGALNAEAMAELVSQLLEMGLDALKEAAAERRIDTSGLETRADYICAIVNAALHDGDTRS